ncbi:hypothetical protein [Bdellovibrio sp. HCB337]|uniref:hypothetical protein n=1 Tax=Bdellovibrio sp. HCB337 TaxID=3394358 RepID=UPI0039A6348F
MKNIVLLLLPLFLLACTSTQVIRDSEYKYSEAAFKFSDPQKALEQFPQKEHGGFVTSIEKSWLGFWAGETNQDDLLAQAHTLDSRQYISLSRETEYFFFNESEEGYIPAEHEIIVMHLISSMYFMRNQQWDKARVEAKQASYFLETFFKADQKHFDDPALRTWLAGIWTALGEWNEAQVDIRKAYELTKDKNLLPWIEQKTAPKELSIAFEGTGPKVTWKFGEPLPGFEQDKEKPTVTISYPTLPWFERHQVRNTLIREQISKSNYMSQYYGIQLGKGAQRSVGFVTANTIRATGVVLGTVVGLGGLYVMAVIASHGGGSGSGELFTLPLVGGFYIAKSFWEEGDKIDESFKEYNEKMDVDGKESLKTYRFVRFMPSWISVTDQLVLTATGKEFSMKSPKSPTTVRFVQKF